MKESERDAANLQRSLALRMEPHFFAASVAVLNATADLRDGILVLRYGREEKASFAVAKQMERGMRHFCDCVVLVERA